MKALVCFVLLTASFLLLLSCTIYIDDGIFDDIDINITMQVTNVEDIPLMYILPHTMTGIPGGTFCDTGSSLLFAVFDQRIVLYEYYKETGITDTFCKDAVCQHNTRSCVAYSIVGNLITVDGEIYALREIGYGGNIAKLVDGRFVDVENTDGVQMFFSWDSVLYAITTDGTLMSFNLSGNDHRIIATEVPISMSWVYGGYYYGLEADIDLGYALSRINLLDSIHEIETIIPNIRTYRTDGKYIYLTFSSREHEHGQLYRTDMAGDNLTEIPIMHTYRMAFDDDYIYYHISNMLDITYENNKHIYRIKNDFSSEPELIYQTKNSWITMYAIYKSDYLFVIDDSDYWLISKDGTKSHRILPFAS
ncbi:MAG: DUF5050 domain-containing protein [Oscillospiraceae bacterium]|nr:DUF5050 domain-containing protein [Oscillospiraceae bacterium]